jgi:hypothetical protein
MIKGAGGRKDFSIWTSINAAGYTAEVRVAERFMSHSAG